MRTCSTDKELVTIALIAPTILKTRAEEDEHYPYVHSHSYPHPSTNEKWYSYGAQDSPVELVYVPPSYICDDADTDRTGDVMAEPYHRSLQPGRFFENSLVASPSPQEDAPIKEDTRMYFDKHSRADAEAGDFPTVLCCAQDIVKTVPVARNLGGPEVVVSSEDTPVECMSRSRSRSRSRSKSHSRSPTPSSPALISVQMPPQSTAVPVSRTNSSHPPSSSGLLQPPDAGMPRGRSVSSPTLSSQSEVPQTRGRSITRTSSYSDRENEGDSPMGSLSPDGAFGLGIGMGNAYAGGRGDREREGVSRLGERGRERVGRRAVSGTSLSPEHQQPPALVTVPPPQPEPKNKRTSASSSSSDSSTISAISVSTTRPSPRLVVDTQCNTRTELIGTSSAPAAIPNQAQTINEEQERISRQPTPANSPVLVMRSAFPSPKSSSTTSPSRHERKLSTGMSRSPTRGDDRQGGTLVGPLVGRAVEIMSNAGAFIGSFWHIGAQASVAAP